LFPNERLLDVFAALPVVQLDSFQVLRGYRLPKLKRKRLWRQDKGKRASASAFLCAIERGGQRPSAHSLRRDC